MRPWADWWRRFTARIHFGETRSAFGARSRFADRWAGFTNWLGVRRESMVERLRSAGPSGELLADLRDRWRRNPGRLWMAGHRAGVAAAVLVGLRAAGRRIGRLVGSSLRAAGGSALAAGRGVRAAVGAGLAVIVLVGLVLWGGGLRLDAAQPQESPSTSTQQNDQSRVGEQAAPKDIHPQPGEPHSNAGVAGLLDLRPGTNYVSLDVNGLVRTAIVEMPRVRPDRDRLPMVIAMHGANGTAEDMISTTGLTGPALSEDIVMVYPQGWNGSWNAEGCCGQARDVAVDDIAFLDALIWQMRTDAMVGSVYLTGFSNGGMMAYRYACQRIVSGLVVMGSSMVNSGCEAPAPVSVLAMHAMPDEVVPYRGGAPDELSAVGWPHIDQVMAYWAGNARCTGYWDSTASTGQFTRNWFGCARGITMEERLSSDGMHLWPTGTGQLDATSAVIDFVLAHE